MKIILLQDIKSIGRKYEIKEVADGYALNKLVPNGMGIPASVGNIKMIEAKKKGAMLETAKTEEELNKALTEIKNIAIEMTGKVNEKGHLFAGIHKNEIIEAIKNQKGLTVAEVNLLLDKPIKEIGEHTLTIKVGEREATFKLIIKNSI